MKFAIVAPKQTDDSQAIVDDVLAWAAEHGSSCLHLADSAAPGDLIGATVLVAVGGDGTILRAVELAAEADVPVIGVNAGRLGYLAEIEPAEVRSALERIERGDFALEHRMTLAVEVAAPDGSLAATHVALNEAAIERAVPGHTVRLATAVDGVAFVVYAGDGLIVATPTGSTAYNLSLRGPVLSPRLDALVVTPIAPHTLFDRSLVLDPREVLTVEVLGPRPGSLAVDGVSMGQLEVGSRVTCRRDERAARFVSFGNRNFQATLRDKFHLVDR